MRGIFGGKGKGKTTFILGDIGKQITGLAEKYIREYGMNVVFIDTVRDRPEPPDYARIKIIAWNKIHLLRKKSGSAARAIIEPGNEEELFQYILQKDITETMFVIEDSAKIVPQNLDKSAFRAICIDSKNKHNSVNLMYHMWSDLPPRLLGIIDRYVIFKTLADHPRDRGIKHRGVLEAYDRVQAHKVNWHHEVVSNE